ncbi:olfactory receptor 5P66-like [Rhinoderma darwinii]|uniref:olfactory receptor 5P66-like n=1 Tax=Rhinoderma darwinii TaxID=43563 RepID=UPI003F6773DE
MSLMDSCEEEVHWSVEVLAGGHQGDDQEIPKYYFFVRVVDFIFLCGLDLWGQRPRELELLRLCLQGDPQSWAFSLRSGNLALLSVEAFPSALGFLYDDPDIATSVAAQLQALKQVSEEEPMLLGPLRLSMAEKYRRRLLVHCLYCSKEGYFAQKCPIKLGKVQCLEVDGEECQGSKLSGHPGITKMYKTLTRSVWWPDIRRHVERFVGKCDICACNETSTASPLEHGHGPGPDENNVTDVVEFVLLGFQGDPQLRIVLFCLLFVLFCLTICGNLLIITLVSTSKNLHNPMYFFISQLSINDILLPANIVPNMLHILLNNGGTITYIGCMTQFLFFASFEMFECLLLTVMSYDRYVAICNPLRYTSIMTSGYCVRLVAIAWLVGFFSSFSVNLTISRLKFCGHNIIDHLFCDFLPLREISCSDTFHLKLQMCLLSIPLLIIPVTLIVICYVNIVCAILRIPSNISRQKAFSTCSSHLTVVFIFYLTIFSVYVLPTNGQTSNMNKITSLLYTVFTPLFNPIIYSLRNKDIKKAVQENIQKHV